MQYRTAAIAATRHRCSLQDTPDENEQLSSQPYPASSQSRQATQDVQQEQVERACTIQQLQQKISVRNTACRQMNITAQPNNLNEKEEMLLQTHEMAHKYVHGAEYVDPAAKTIFRCALCASLLNS